MNRKKAEIVEIKCFHRGVLMSVPEYPLRTYVSQNLDFSETSFLGD